MAKYANPYDIKHGWTPERLSLWHSRLYDVRQESDKPLKYTPPIPIVQTWAPKFGPAIALHAREVRAAMLEDVRKLHTGKNVGLAALAEHCTLMHYPPLASTRDEMLNKLWTRILAGEQSVLTEFIDGIPERVAFAVYFEYHPVRVTDMLVSLISALAPGVAEYSPGYMPPVSKHTVTTNKIFAKACPFSPRISLEIERRAEEVVRQLVWTIRRMMSSRMLLPDADRKLRIKSVRAVFCLTALEQFKGVVEANGDQLPFIACIRDVHNMNVMLGARDIGAVDVRREHAMCFECLAVNTDVSKRRRIDSARYFIRDDVDVRCKRAGIAMHSNADKLFGLIEPGKKTRFSETVLYVHSTISYEFVSIEHHDCPGYRHADKIEFDEDLIRGQFDAPTAEVAARASVEDVKWCIKHAEDGAPPATDVASMFSKHLKIELKKKIEVVPVTLEKIKEDSVVGFYNWMLLFMDRSIESTDFKEVLSAVKERIEDTDFISRLNEHAFTMLTYPGGDTKRKKSVCFVMSALMRYPSTKTIIPTESFQIATKVNLILSAEKASAAVGDEEKTRLFDVFFNLLNRFIAIDDAKYKLSNITNSTDYVNFNLANTEIIQEKKVVLTKIVVIFRDIDVPKDYIPPPIKCNIIYEDQPATIFKEKFNTKTVYERIVEISNGEPYARNDVIALANFRAHHIHEKWPGALDFKKLLSLPPSATTAISSLANGNRFYPTTLDSSYFQSDLILKSCFSLVKWSIEKWAKGKQTIVLDELELSTDKCIEYWDYRSKSVKKYYESIGNADQQKKIEEEKEILVSGVSSLVSLRDVLHHMALRGKPFYPRTEKEKVFDFLHK